MTAEVVPVLIAGGGPVGLTLAYDLASRGIRCMLVERNHETTRHPKMDITNSRTMELFRRAGLAEALRAVAVPEDHPFDVSWVTTMSGHELHRFRYPSVTEGREAARRNNTGGEALEPPMRVSQVEIEPALKRAAESLAGIDLRFGCEFADLVQDGDGVLATIRMVDDNRTSKVRCQYLVGCDGGGSRVRECLGIAQSGQSRIMPRFMTHFRSDARDVLQRWGVAWHYQSVHGTMIAQNDRDVWTLHSRGPATEEENIDPSALVRTFVGSDIPHTVLVANRWSPHLLVADRFGRGRVLLAGDAVHQYIPTGGYGMNTGIADAFDIGWKLAAVLHGFGGRGLLDSYESERRPVALRNCEGSRRHNEIRKQIGNLYGPELMRDDAEGERARAAVAARIRELGNAENECRGLELGYCYASSPIVATEPSIDAPEDIVSYTPTTRPGARLPHIFLRDGTALFDRLGRWFTLLAFERGLADSFVRAAAPLGIPLELVEIAEPELDTIYGARLVLVRPDQHVAWRGNKKPDRAEAETVLSMALGRATPAIGVSAIGDSARA